MRVYRIEHRKTRKGPYQPEPDGDTPAEYGGRFGCDIYYNSATHPGPFCAKEWDTQLAQGKPDGGGRWKRSWGRSLGQLLGIGLSLACGCDCRGCELFRQQA